MKRTKKSDTGRFEALHAAYTKELNERALFKESDATALERLCRLEIQADDLLEQIEREGALQTDRDGTTRRHPALMALQNISQMVDALKKGLAIGGYYRHRIGEKPTTERKQSVLAAFRPGYVKEG